MREGERLDFETDDRTWGFVLVKARFVTGDRAIGESSGFVVEAVHNLVDPEQPGEYELYQDITAKMSPADLDRLADKAEQEAQAFHESMKYANHERV